MFPVDDLATALFSIFYYTNRHHGFDRANSLKMAQVSLRNLSGEEFTLNYAKGLTKHLTAYARQIQADRKKIDRTTDPQEYNRLTEIYNKTMRIREDIQSYSQIKQPFAKPYYWAAFTCQGLA